MLCIRTEDDDGTGETVWLSLALQRVLHLRFGEEAEPWPRAAGPL